MWSTIFFHFTVDLVWSELVSQISFLLVTLLASDLPTTVVSNSSTPLEVADPTVNKPEPSVTGQKSDSVIEAGIQATSEQPNGAATSQDMTQQTEEIGLLKSPVSQQGESPTPVGDSAAFLVSEKCVASLEMLNASSEESNANEKAVSVQEEQSKEMAVGAQESISQKSDRMPVEVNVFEEKRDPEHCGPEDTTLSSKDVVPTDSFSPTKEDQKISGPHPTQDELLPCDLNVNVATQNESLDEEGPVTSLSKAVQSKGNAKCEGPPLSTRPMSGWFFLHNKQMLLIFLFLLKW